MKLQRLTERVWCYPYEEARDRPNLGYIRGDHWSMAVDAGHSDAHVEAFYAALREEGLPLPSLTVLTHWHWDHCFGLHRISGLSLANALTNRYLLDFRAKVEKEGAETFLSLHESIRLEYARGRPIHIDPADIVFSGALELDAGGCPIRVFQAEAPHTDDSTLVYAPGEGVLFVGDAEGGTFPTWERDAALARKLADTIRETGPALCVEGHWQPVPTEDLIRELTGE
ncbi:MAG: MBL fold metallo-hydrolase [Clostridia bacterium]|nr:MBL fold metallo-hydrolase [Clostridia bacterium]